MRVAVLGATGRTGGELVRQALDQGHQVTALARDPARHHTDVHTDVHTATTGRPAGGAPLRWVIGDAADPAAVAEALDGADAVVSTVGRRKGGPPVCTQAVRAVLTVLGDAAPAPRLLVLSNYGLGESRRPGPYLAAARLLARHTLADQDAMEALLRASTADWTVIRPPVLTDGPATHAYRAAPDLRVGFRSRLSRADLAHLLLTVLTDPAAHPSGARRALTVVGPRRQAR